MRSLQLSSYLCTLTLSLLTLNQPPALAAPPPPSKLTLSQTLAAAPPPDGLTLTVSADKLTLPDSSVPPPAGTAIADIASAFGDITANFGAVTAVAPSTMVVLNTNPDAPNVMLDLSRLTALKMLAASLDDTQWAAFTSERGLGLSDLTDDTQRSLFHSLFRNGQLWIGSSAPALSDLPEEKRTDVRNMTDQIDSTRLRLGQTAHMYLHDSRGKTIYSSGYRPDAAQRMSIYRPKTPSTPTSHGVILRAEVANTMKQSDLNWERSELQVTVPIIGLKTVDDLMTRIGQKTGLELYADPHYAARTLNIFGTETAAPATDLLQALCLCVTGTFRKVGPAFVLTDDLLGVGVRRKQLSDWGQKAADADAKLSFQAGTVMLSRRRSAGRTLPTFGDPLGLTPQEMSALPDDPGLPGIPQETDLYPFAKLSPGQQEWARQTAVSYDEQLHSNSLPSYLDGDDLGDADLTRGVNLRVNYTVQMLIPSVNSPVDTTMSFPIFMLFFEGDTEQSRQSDAAAGAQALAKLPPAPPLSLALKSGRRRAVLGHPRSASDVDALVASMQKLGLNQLWLDVFSGDIDHVKTSSASGPDILTEALNRTRGTGIAVYADLSLLSWGNEPPEAVRDLTIEGLTNREAAIAAEKTKPAGSTGDESKPVSFIAPPVQVSPMAAGVRDTLSALVKNLSERPGLSGFVWENAGTDDDLGYTPEMRLVFLRTVHADPLDITPETDIRDDTALPLFDDAVVDAALPKQRAQAKSDAANTLLDQLSAISRANSGGNILPILVGDDLMISWDAIKLQMGQDQTRPTQMVMPLATQREKVENDGDTAALAQMLADKKPFPTNGFVLDFDSESVTQGPAPLDSLVRAVFSQKAVK